MSAIVVRFSTLLECIDMQRFPSTCSMSSMDALTVLEPVFMTRDCRVGKQSLA
jgi:hypothetical protein